MSALPPSAISSLAKIVLAKPGIKQAVSSKSPAFRGSTEVLTLAGSCLPWLEEQGAKEC